MSGFNLRLADLQLNTRTVIRINNLAIKAQLLSGKHFFVHKNLYELIELLKYGQSSCQPDVKEHYTILANFVDRDTLGFFRILGVDLKPEPTIEKPTKLNIKNIFELKKRN
jgi:hypothetical protein